MKTTLVLKATAYFLGLCASFLIGSSVKMTSYNNQKEVISSYNSYYNHCEALLDSIAANDDSFMDTIGETDAYCDYQAAKDSLNTVLKKK